MIPKIIHCVWLSGEEKPRNYQNCIKSWSQHMPDFEIKEWSLKNLPDEVLQHKYVRSALAAKKWAYATDYIRLWVLYTFGGIYLDMDVMVFKPFDIFLKHRLFTSIELFPEAFYKSLRKHNKEIIGLGIEAAVLGAEKGHPMIADVMEYYKDLGFVNSPEYYYNYIMPRVLTRVARDKYGFRLVPNYQILKEDIHIYPCDVFSSVYDFNILQLERNNNGIAAIGSSPIRYALHLCAHGWWEGDHTMKTWQWKLKHLLLKCIGGKNPIKKTQLT